MPPQPNPSDAFKGKVVIIGEYSVGKTCLSHRFINRSYTGRMEPTIGAAFQVRTLPVNTSVAMQSLPVTAAVISQLSGGAGGVGNAQSAPSSLNDAHNGGAILSSSTHGNNNGPHHASSSSGTSSACPAVSHVKLELWDTAGSERYRSLMPMYFRDASAAVICYDIGNSASFERVSLWLNDFRKHNEGCSAGGGSAGGPNGGGTGSLGAGETVEAVLCGTKCDISNEKREVSFDEAQAFADQHGMAFFETSAKRDINVQELFFSVAHAIYRSKVKARLAAANGGNGHGAGSTGGNSVAISGSRGGAGGKVDLSEEGKKTSKSCC